MYGSIARWHIKEGKQQELEELVAKVVRDRASAGLAVHVYRSDSDPPEYWVAGVFKSREAYRASSDVPGTASGYQQLRGLMDSDPEWHDGEVIASG
jgi:quinol monooxygenase YgiN